MPVKPITLPIPTFDEKTIQEFKTDMLSMKQMNLPEEIDYMKELLKKTLHYRQKILKEEKLDIFTEYNYIFVCPELVSSIFYFSFFNES